MKDLKATTQARVLYQEVFCKFGIPRKTISDRGTAFKNEFINKYLAKRLGIKWTFCSPQNPRANGKIERVHRTLKATLQAFCRHQHDEWQTVLQPFVWTMNTTACSAIQHHTPYMMMFGKHPRHPLDLQTETQKFRSQDEQLAAALGMRHTAKEMIRRRFEALNAKKEPKYARSIKYVSFQEGDQVLIWDDNIPKGIARKLHPRWIGPFTILNRTGAYVYEVLYKGKKKVVHARRLIEYQQYLLEDWEKPEIERKGEQPAGSEAPEAKERGESAELVDPEDGELDEMINLDPPEPPVLSKRRPEKQD